MNGGVRTGSTLVYNIARAACQGADPESGLLGPNHRLPARLRASAPAAPVVWKCHVWDAPRTLPADARVLYTHRNAGDVAASLRRVGGPWTWPAILDEITRQTRRTAWHRARARAGVPVCVLDYDVWYAHLPALCATILAHLGPCTPAPPPAAGQVADAVAPIAMRRVAATVPPGQHDPATLLQHAHLGPDDGRPGAARAALTPAEWDDVAAAVARA